MGGTTQGGHQASQTNKQRYGEDYYKRIGIKGGKVGGPEYQKGGSKPTGFAANIERAKAAGSIGGRISRKGKHE